ncbi:MAG TPA: amidohydrolase family protein [Pyrinomonadaceae bacterium]|nr:amidohydrolase family protein [Pyrinomonadaceae bacterium]
MRNLRSRRHFARIVVAALMWATVIASLPLRQPMHAQRRAIDTYAITNARIVTVSGPVIERGTVVVRDGLIAAVGANASAPADARIIDGAGLTVYPGLIDASTTLGIPRPTPAPGASPNPNPFAAFLGPAAPPSATSPNSTQPPGLQPEILAADIVRPGGEQIEAARNAGVTSALTVPRSNVFLGQSAFINLAGETPQQMIVRAPVALHVGFTPLAGSYPGSLMGVFSSVRQMLLDAQRYREANAVYDRNPRGMRRPEQDKSLAALLPALARQMPVVMQAEREREIVRALDLAQEFNLQVVIAGGLESWKVAERLKTMNVPVLLSLNFPKRTTAENTEADPEPLRTLRERAEAPKAAARLAAAGVPFAFQSGSMTNMADYLANAGKAVESGLARDEALRALTLRAADILGVDDRLGSIEVGKIANLTVTRGDLFDRSRRITHVFIDGRPVDLKPETTAAATGAANVSGTWSLRVNTGGIGETPEVNITLLLQQQGDRITGSIQGPLGTSQIANASQGAAGELRFTVPVQIGGQTTEANFVGAVTGNEMRGTVEIVGRGSGTFTGTRPNAPATTTPAPAPSPPSKV